VVVYQNFTPFFFLFFYWDKECGAKHKSFATQIMRDRIDIINYYNDKKLKFSIEDLYHNDGSAAGTKDVLYIPLDLKTRH